MPTAPAYACPVPRCPERQPCPVHSAESRKTRANRAVRAWYRIARWCHPDYGLRWQCLRRDPLCVVCLAKGRIVAATEVDHVVPHKGDPRLFWDLANLQGLCTWCHGEKSGREQGGG